MVCVLLRPCDSSPDLTICSRSMKGSLLQMVQPILQTIAASKARYSRTRNGFEAKLQKHQGQSSPSGRGGAPPRPFILYICLGSTQVSPGFEYDSLDVLPVDEVFTIPGFALVVGCAGCTETAQTSHVV